MKLDKRAAEASAAAEEVLVNCSFASVATCAC